MKQILIKVIFALSLVGFDALKFFNFFRGIPFYFKNYQNLKKQMKQNNDFAFGKLYPILDERFCEGGTMRGHYFHQDLLIAQKIYNNKPIRHVDIGSRMDGFVAHVASFRELEIFDIRQLSSSVKNVLFTQADLMQLQENMKACCDSLSSLHAIEHFGLGRYGDPIDINGHIKAIENIWAMLKTGGKFYFATPIGPQRIEFNAHRVFSIEYLIKVFDKKFTIDNFSYVNDNGHLFENEPLSSINIASNFNCKYGCGIFTLTKVDFFQDL